MTAKLTLEQREALLVHGDPLPVRDEQTQQLYYLIEAATLDAYRRREDDEAIRCGVADMEAGRVHTLDELDARIRTRLGLATP